MEYNSYSCNERDIPSIILYQCTINIQIEGDQKVSMHLMITMQSSGAQRLCDHPVEQW